MVVKATLDAEYSVIGCLLVDPSIAGELISLTRPEDFTVPELRTVYNAAVKLFSAGRPVDAVTIRGVCGAEYNNLLMQCMEITPTAFGWRTYISAMQEQTRVTRLRELAAQMADVRTSAQGRDLLGKAGEILSEKSAAQIVTMEQALVQFYTEQGEKRRFISWGFDKLDRRLYSDHGDFVIVAGRPSAGKTALALQMAALMGQHDKVGFYSLETSPAKLTNRLVANRCIIDFGRINRREMTEEEWSRVVKWKKEVSSTQLEMVPASGWGVQDILSTALSRQHRIVFIDYLQLLRSRGRDRHRAGDKHFARSACDGAGARHPGRSAQPAVPRQHEPGGRRADAHRSARIRTDRAGTRTQCLRCTSTRTRTRRRTTANCAYSRTRRARWASFRSPLTARRKTFAEYMDGQLAAARQIERMEAKAT